MKKSKKLLVSDYDQTFYTSDDDIEKNKIKVNSFRNEGNIFVFATGRSYFDFKKKVNAYNLEYDYVILNHGATIMNNKDEVLYNFSIDNTIVENIKYDINFEDCINYFYCSLFENHADFPNEDLTKIYLKYCNKEKAMEFNKVINEKYNKYVNSFYVTGDAIEIISNKTNKSYAIKLLSKKLKIPKKNIYTIGDGYSDLIMIKDYNGYCMENSIQELLEYCQNNKVKSVGELIDKVYFESLYLKLNKYPFFKKIKSYELNAIQDYGRKSKFQVKTEKNIYTLIMTENRIAPYIKKIKLLGEPFKKMIGFRYLSKDKKILVLDYFGNGNGIDLLKVDKNLSNEQIDIYVEQFKSIVDSIHMNKFEYIDFDSNNKEFKDYYINEISEKIKSIYDKKIVDKYTYQLLIKKLKLSSNLLLENTLIHADITPLNVCINEQERYLYLIDYDDVKIGDPMMDISRIINCKGMSKIFNRMVEKYYKEYENNINHLFYTLRVNINWYNHIIENNQENIYDLKGALDSILEVINKIINYK